MGVDLRPFKRAHEYLQAAAAPGRCTQLLVKDEQTIKFS